MFPEVSAITTEMTNTFEGISRLIMLDRYSFKDQNHQTLDKGDLVILTTKEDPQYPARGIGWVKSIDDDMVSIEVEEEYRSAIEILLNKLMVLSNDGKMRSKNHWNFISNKSLAESLEGFPIKS